MQLYADIHISDGKSVNPNDLHYLRNNILTLDPGKAGASLAGNGSYLSPYH